MRNLTALLALASVVIAAPGASCQSGSPEFAPDDPRKILIDEVTRKALESVREKGDTLFFYSGNDLRSECLAGKPTVFAATCLGYVVGVADGIKFFEDLTGFPTSFCTPRGVTKDQLSAVALKYLSANPEKLHEPAFRLVWGSLKESFPCTAKAK